MRSLRTRLLVGIISALVLLLVVFSITIYMVIRNALVNQFDASLTSTARMLSTLTEQEEDEIDLESEIQLMLEFRRADRPAYYQFWAHDGAVLQRSVSLGTDDLLPFGGTFDAPAFRALPQKNGRPLRAISFEFEPRLDRPKDVNEGGDKKSIQPAKQQAVTLVVARDAGDLQYNLLFLQWLLLIASAGTIGLSLLVGLFVVRRGLGPLSSIAAEIAAVREDDLTVRIGAERIPDELMPIRKRLNDLLSRLEAAFNRERRFTADVAHELRTPLAGMRSTLEVTLKRIRDANEYQASLSDCLAIARNMQAMVDNLLTLARLDTHQMTFRRGRIRLAELVDSCWQSFSDRARQRSILFDNRIPAELHCQSDTESISMVLSNLLNNAVEYTDKAGQVWTTARRTDGSVEITVANTGCRLTDEQLAQVFDCFWRADSSRTDTGVHCGLGLALVQRIVRALGGDAVVELQNGGIFTIRLSLPS